MSVLCYKGHQGNTKSPKGVLIAEGISSVQILLEFDDTLGQGQ